jgi:hypothetical protein
MDSILFTTQQVYITAMLHISISGFWALDKTRLTVEGIYRWTFRVELSDIINSIYKSLEQLALVFLPM